MKVGPCSILLSFNYIIHIVLTIIAAVSSHFMQPATLIFCVDSDCSWFLSPRLTFGLDISLRIIFIKQKMELRVSESLLVNFKNHTPVHCINLQRRWHDFQFPWLCSESPSCVRGETNERDAGDDYKICGGEMVQHPSDDPEHPADQTIIFTTCSRFSKHSPLGCTFRYSFT